MVTLRACTEQDFLSAWTPESVSWPDDVQRHGISSTNPRGHMTSAGRSTDGPSWPVIDSLRLECLGDDVSFDSELKHQQIVSHLPCLALDASSSQPSQEHRERAPASLACDRRPRRGMRACPRPSSAERVGGTCLRHSDERSHASAHSRAASFQHDGRLAALGRLDRAMAGTPA